MTFSHHFLLSNSFFGLYWKGGLVVADIGGCAGDEPLDFCYQSLPQRAQFIES